MNTTLDVLIVDDDEALLRSLGRSLRSHGLFVQTAASGEEALALLRQQCFDAVLLDLHMDGMDGWSVLEESVGLRPRPTIIVHSAYVDVRSAAEAMRRGAVDVIEKPTSSAEIAERLRHLVGRQRPRFGSERLLGASPQMRLVREQIARVAQYPDLSVLIRGETGTGKELVAKAIHEVTLPDGPFVPINAAAVPGELFESELFGHRAGSFTGARTPRIGLLEAAGAGTFFLDEVGELPISLQPKLLRVLENRAFRRIGSNEMVPLRARVVSATNRPLGSELHLRSDLYFRLAGFVINLPPLRDRMSDLPVIAEHLLLAFAQRYPMSPRRMAPAAMEVLQGHHWPGNVRELRAVIEQAAVLCRSDEIGLRHVASALEKRQTEGEAYESERPSGIVPRSGSLRDMERQVILEAYRDNQENLSRTARELDMPRTTLRDKLRRYGVR